MRSERRRLAFAGQARRRVDWRPRAPNGVFVEALPTESPRVVEYPKIQGLSDPGSGVHQTCSVRVVTLAVTAPAVLAGLVAEACSNGVVAYVGDGDRELALVFDRLRLERPLEEVTAAPVPVVEVQDVRAEQSLHGIAEVGGCSDHDQVKVVPHQAVGT